MRGEACTDSGDDLARLAETILDHILGIEHRAKHPIAMPLQLASMDPR